MPPLPYGRGIKEYRDPSICPFIWLSHTSSLTVHFRAGCYKTLIGNPRLEVEPTGQRGRTATGSAPLQKHS